MSDSARCSSYSHRMIGPRTLTWVYHVPSSSAVSETWGCSRIQVSRARPASMFTRIVPSSSTRYQVATDIGWPLAITTAITAGLGRRSRAAAPGGSGARGMVLLLVGCGSGASLGEGVAQCAHQCVRGALDHLQHL